MTLFIPGNWDKSGVLAGRCPVYNTQHVLALMVWPHFCISLVSAVGLCAARGDCREDWVLGWIMGSTPAFQFWEGRGWGWLAAFGRILPEEHGCCSQVWGHLGFMSSLCAQPLPHCWPTSVTPWLFLFALDIAAFSQQQPVNVFLGLKGGWFEHLSIRSYFHIYNILIEATVYKSQALPTGSGYGYKAVWLLLYRKQISYCNNLFVFKPHVIRQGCCCFIWTIKSNSCDWEYNLFLKQNPKELLLRDSCGCANADTCAGDGVLGQEFVKFLITLG